MENAVDALKIAFGVFALVLAITLTFMLISQAKTTADHVMYYTDNTNFYRKLNSSENNRTVSLAEVISTLHRYYIESMSVTVIIDDNEYIFDSGRETSITSDTVKKLDLPDHPAKETYLKSFIKDKLQVLPEGKTFVEDFTEIPLPGGIYDVGEDGTEVVLSRGGKKVYITYTLK